ncbi:cytochrome P450 [Vararia minispora EC-137]|uniref:Cytochrome P450 n=1 Tax=Vararia minispora EC-137 TaxID=1314806 RepID=A0ACB8QXF2_9AGAM|nr:cytochrome P450 [Vararia minispora EC-137]
MTHPRAISFDFSVVDKGALALVGISSLVYVLLWLRGRRSRSALRDMTGPPRVSWIWGSSPAGAPVWDVPRLQLDWMKSYGRTFKFHGLLGETTLYAGDLHAAAHVLSNSKYERSPLIRATLAFIGTSGILSVEGAQHKRQRRVMNPAFGLIELRKHTEVFVSKANELCSIWKDMCNNSDRDDGSVKVDAFEWMNKVTLDIICLAGFNYDTAALRSTNDQPNEMNKAVRTMFSFELNEPIFVLQTVFPILRLIPTRRMRQIRESQELIQRIGKRLIVEKKNALLKGSGNEGGPSAMKKNDIEGSDLLSLLIKANMAADLPENLRLGDEDILAQVPTFIVAGHETTSTAVTWGLFALSCAPRVQEKLRAELRQVATDTPSMDELNALPYLDMVLREVLRLYSPSPAVRRNPSEDDVIPLSKPYTDKSGTLHHEVVVSKGDCVAVPISALHVAEDIWGWDAGEFRPERWESVPEAVKQIPNMWGNVLAFVSGSRSCIGYRFAVIEYVKALLFSLVRSFEFGLAVTPAEVIRKTAVVVRPWLSTNPTAGAQLPLTIRPVTE